MNNFDAMKSLLIADGWIENKQFSNAKELRGGCPKCGTVNDPESDRFRITLSNGKITCRTCGGGANFPTGYLKWLYGNNWRQEAPRLGIQLKNNDYQDANATVDLSRVPDDVPDTSATPDDAPPQPEPKSKPTTGPVVDTVYADLEDYNKRGQGLLYNWLYDQGWRDGTLHGRPGITIPSTDDIPRFRFIDGKKPKYMPTTPLPKGETSQWYKFPDDKENLIVLTNGQASVEVARFYGIKAAFAFTDGEGAIPKHLINRLKQRFAAVSDTVCIIALDADDTGRTAKEKICKQLTGYPVRVVDFGGNSGYDLADFCNQYKTKSAKKLAQLSQLPDNAQVVTSKESNEVIWNKLAHTERFIGVEEYVPMPWKSFHRFGGQMEVLDPGLVSVVGMLSGGGKTSLLETWCEDWLQQGFDILWRGEEWSNIHYAIRRMQRWGGITTNQFKRWEMWKSEDERGIPHDKRRGQKIPDAVKVKSFQLKHEFDKWPGQVHYFPAAPFIEDTIADMESRLHELRRNGRRVAVAVWDYISLFRSQDTNENNQPESVTHAIKSFSKRTRLHSLCASQIKKDAAKYIREGKNEPLSASDLYYVRDDKFNLILGVNPIFEKVSNDGIDDHAFTGRARVEILKNSDGLPHGHISVRAHLDHLTWKETE